MAEEVQQVEQKQEQQPSNQERNFAQIRKNLEQSRYELEQERNARIRLEEEIKSIKSDKSSSDDEEAETDDPYVDRKTFNKKLKKVEQEIEKRAEEKIRKIVEEEREASRQFRLKAEYPDFEEVLNENTASVLQERHPGLAKKLLQIPDTQLRQEMAYQMIKTTGLHKKEEPKNNIQEKIDSNRRSLYYYPSGVANPSSSNMGDFSESGKKNAYQQMQGLIAKRKS